MTKNDYVDMLAEVQRSVSDTKTQVAFLESMVKFLPIGQQRGVRAYFADVQNHLRQALHGLQEPEEWLRIYCPEWVPPQPGVNATVECEIPTFQTMPKEGE